MAKAWWHSRSGIEGLRPDLITSLAGGSVSSFFSLGNKKPMLVSIHAESTGVTRVIDVRPVLEGSGRDADPCQRQLLGPSVLAKNDCYSARRR